MATELIRTKEYVERTTCRSCGEGGMREVLSLGDQYLVDFSNAKPPKVPLVMCLCEGCKLVQLKHTTNPDLLYTEHYGYRSGINEVMREELWEIVSKVEETVGLKEGDVVVDIGANDGTTLSYYKEKVYRMGFDASKNMGMPFYNTMKEAGKKVDEYKIILEYFNQNAFYRNSEKKARVVTAISMFYDLDNPNRFLEDINGVLDDEGLLLVQQNYLVGMLKQTAFDNICHEHLEYFSLTAMNNLLARNKMEVFDVEETPINGGSFRTYIRKIGSSLSRVGGMERVQEMLKSEEEMGLLETEVYEAFGDRVRENGHKLKEFIEDRVSEGKKVYVYGASTRGNTLLQSYKIDGTIIAGAAERNLDKTGKMYGNSGIPIVSEEEARSKADYFLCLPWFLKKSFVEREKEFLDRGGRLIIPLPEFELI